MNRSQLRITIIGLNYSPEPTGNAPYTTSLAEGLAAAGHRVSVITGYPHYPEWRLRPDYAGWSRVEVINGVSVHRLRHFVPSNPSLVQRLHLELSFGLRLLLAPWNKPDVVLTVSPALFSCAFAVVRAKGSPRRPALGIWVQDIYSRGLVETGSAQGTSVRLALRAESWILRAANGVVAIHERFKRYMVETLEVPADSVEVIRNWTHLQTPPPSDRESTRLSLGWTSDEIVVLHAGNMGKKQGLENVIEAARLATLKNSRVRFVLMGDGNQRARLEASAVGIDKIAFVDPLAANAFQAALAAADVLLVNEMPGISEMAVPSKLTSYFSTGLPVIAATESGSVTHTEVMASGGGVQVNAGDPDALLDAAERLAADSELAKAIGAKGLRFRQETLSESAAIAHYDEFVSRLASARDR